MTSYLTAKKLLDLMFLGERIEGARFFAETIQLLISCEFDSNRLGHNGQGVINIYSPWNVVSDLPGQRPTRLNFPDLAEELDLLKLVIGKEIIEFSTFEDSMDLVIHLDNDLEIILTADPQLAESWFAGICLDKEMDCKLYADADTFSIGAPEEVWALLGLEPPRPPQT